MALKNYNLQACQDFSEKICTLDISAKKQRHKSLFYLMLIIDS